jgi:flagellar export protein FliJ
VKRFHFRLAPLLQLRAFHERKAELVLAERAGACAVLEARISENLERRVRSAGEGFAPGRDISDFRTTEFYLRRLDVERERMTAELAACEIAREEARSAYILKRRDREAVDKIRERRETEYYRLALREETKVLDDLARRPQRADAAPSDGPARRAAASGE